MGTDLVGCEDKKSSWNIVGFSSTISGRNPPFVVLSMKNLNASRPSEHPPVIAVVVVIPFIMDVRFVDVYQPGSHRRKVTQDFSTFLMRCLP